MTNRNNSIIISRGDSLALTHTIKDSNGSAVDISSTTPYFTVKTNDTYPDGSAIIQKTGDLTDPTNGECTFILDPTDTAIAIDSYYFDIQITFSGSDIRTSESGTFQVLQDVTKA